MRIGKRIEHAVKESCELRGGMMMPLYELFVLPALVRGEFLLATTFIKYRHHEN